MTTFSSDTDTQTRQQTIMNDTMTVTDRTMEDPTADERTAHSPQPQITLFFSRRQHIGEPTLLLKVTVKLD